MGARLGLTINADDFGIDRGRDFGILLLALLRCLDSVSAFAVPRYDGGGQLRRMLSRLRPRLRVGLHVDLTDGPLQTEAMDRLFERRTYQDKREFWARAVAGDVAASCVAEEVRAQIKAFRMLYGFAPDHLDGHNHVHIAHPDVYSAFRDVQAEYRLPPLRLPTEDLGAAQVARLVGLDDALAPDPVLDRLRAAAPLAFYEIDVPLADLVERMRRSTMCDVSLYAGATRRLQASGIDLGRRRFHGTFFGWAPSMTEAVRIKRDAWTDGDPEFMVHPGLNLASSRRGGFSSRRRALEWIILALMRVAA